MDVGRDGAALASTDWVPDESPAQLRLLYEAAAAARQQQQQRQRDSSAIARDGVPAPPRPHERGDEQAA